MGEKVKLNNDLKQIKDYYGENMMHLCRSLFPSILETNGLLFKLLSEHFANTRLLVDDINNSLDLRLKFKDYIVSLAKKDEIEEELVKTDKTLEELMNEAGYILYECHTNEEIHSFKKYYAPGEELCTFKDDHRLDENYVFFAVKKDVDNIKRSEIPEREDSYGRSVISIQFTKGNINTVSIKNRYNHGINKGREKGEEINPDATFENNLENIIPGLTYAFNEKYNLNIKNSKYGFSVPGYVMASDGKYYKYNYEINNVYYCPNNIIIDNSKVIKFDKERYIILDYFILDMKEKTIKLYDENISDCFIDGLSNIKKTDIKVDKENNIKKIIINDSIEIILNKTNKIIKYKNNSIAHIGNNFLNFSTDVNELELSNARTIGHNFLKNCKNLSEVKMLYVKNIGNNFLKSDYSLIKIEVPSVEQIGDGFLYSAYNLKEILLRNAKTIGNEFVKNANNLIKIEIPNVEKIGNNCLYYAFNLEEFSANNVKIVGDSLLQEAYNLKKIELFNCKQMGNLCLYNCVNLKELILLNAIILGKGILGNNNVLAKVEIPNVKNIAKDETGYCKNNDIIISTFENSLNADYFNQVKPHSR